MDPQLSLDDMASEAALNVRFEGSSDRTLAKGGPAGDMPTTRGGSSGAEGGFTPQAGGQSLDAVKGGSQWSADDVRKGVGPKTGAAMTSEPGRQGPDAQTGSDMTNEPKGQPGGGSGEGGNLAQTGDDSARSRKAGKVGGMSDSGADSGRNVSEDEDEATRSRKAGKVGMAKGSDVDEEEDDDAEKSFVAVDDLMKSLETLEAIASGSTIAAPAERRAQLAKSLEAGTLSSDEMQELGALMKSSEPFADSDDFAVDDFSTETDDLAKSYQEAFADDDTLGEGYEVSTFLERHSQMTAAALDQLQDNLSKSLDSNQDRATSYNTQLAKSLMGMARVAQSQESLIKSQGALIQGLVDRVEGIESTPQPRRAAVNQSQALLSKSLGAGEVGPDQSGQLSKADIMGTLENMAMSGATMTKSGHQIDMSMAMLEAPGGQVARSLLNDVIAFRKNGQ